MKPNKRQLATWWTTLPKPLSNPDIDICLLLTVLACSIWWPTRNLPHHWDAAAFVIRSAQDLHHHITPLIASYSEFAHPPLIPLLVAISWRLLGQSLLSAHLVVLPFTIILILSTYFVGKKLHSRLIGITSALLVIATPFFLAETSMVYLDLPVAALTTLALVLVVNSRIYMAAAIFSLALLTKMTILPLIVLVYLLKPKRHLPILILPLSVAALYLAYHYQVTGWWLTAPGRETVTPQNLPELINSIKFVAYVFFVRQNRWLLSVLTLLCLSRDYKKIPKNIWLLAVGCLTGLIVFAVSGEYIPRYSLYLLPLYYLFSSFIMYRTLPKPLSHIVIIVILLVFSRTWHPPLQPSQAFEFRINEDLSVKDHIETGIKVAAFIEQEYPSATIIGGFPQSYQLTEPIHGYVKSPLEFTACDAVMENIKPTTLLYLHPYHYTQFACQALLKQYDYEEIATFNTNGKWAKLYALKPSHN